MLIKHCSSLLLCLFYSAFFFYHVEVITVAESTIIGPLILDGSVDQ